MQADRSAQYSQAATDAARGPPEALGQSEIFLEFLDRLSRAAKVNRSVLIVGERGTGKELAAARLHYLSERWQGPLVALNCAALAPSLLESELFGHEAGAFTGATQRRRGRFEAADGGTLFLDEIGLIPIEVQEKILRVVEYGSFERVGGSQSVELDVRIIGATNADLVELAENGTFKRDLLDRLSFEVLFIPPLRIRKDDVMLLARHFAAGMASEIGRDGIPGFSDEAVGALEDYEWPGNVRELKNVVERAIYRCEDNTVNSISFDPFRSPFASLKNTSGKPIPPASSTPHIDEIIRGDKSLTECISEFERDAIKKALTKAHFHQTNAARILGISYHQFRGLYRKYKERLDVNPSFEVD